MKVRSGVTNIIVGFECEHGNRSRHRGPLTGVGSKCKKSLGAILAHQCLDTPVCPSILLGSDTTGP